jgi:hypothetical protein
MPFRFPRLSLSSYSTQFDRIMVAVFSFSLFLSLTLPPLSPTHQTILCVPSLTLVICFLSEVFIAAWAAFSSTTVVNNTLYFFLFLWICSFPSSKK